MLNQLRAYRRLRVAISLLLVLPRYVLLLIRERFASRAPSERAWNRAHQAAANQLERLALDLAGGFIKVAQVGGARADFLPEPFIDTLSQFHDRVPPRPFETLRPMIEEDLAAPLDALFAYVDTRALAAASLAQVHRARLMDGSDVVIKIRYPEVHRTVPSDLASAALVARIARRLRPSLDLTSVVDEVHKFVALELDFEREAAATERFGRILENDPRVRIPAVHHKLCGRRVIVLEYLDGIQVTQLDALRAAGHKLSDVAERIGSLYGAMIFGRGYFHGDPHPGNLMVMMDGRIGLIDFGLAKELPENFASQVANMMVSALIGDTKAALRAAERLGFDVDGLSAGGVRALVLMLMGDSDGEQSFFEVIGQNEIRGIPSHFGLVARTLVLLNGLSHRLAPGRRMIQGALMQELAQAVQKQTTEVRTLEDSPCNSD